jgi:hypothetical protein
MNALLARVGALGLAALILVGAAGAFHVALQRPLERELQALEGTLARDRSRPAARQDSAPAAQMAAFYRFFEQPGSSTQLLAKLYALGRAVGVEPRTADYRPLPTGTRITRYQITLPLAGSYAQVRSFAENALNEIPVLSLDQASFRRKSANDAQLEAEIVMTLHLLEP